MMETRDVVLLLMISALVSVLLGSLVSSASSKHMLINWTETCWPNKPVWTEQPGVCWVNGQKIIID